MNVGLVEYKLNCCAAWQQSCEIMAFVSHQARMHTGVVRPRGVNWGNCRLIGAEMEGCQVRDGIVGERDMSFSRILYMVCGNGGYLALTFSISWINKPSGKSKKRFNGRLWEINGGIYPVAHSGVVF